MRLIDADALLKHEIEADRMGAMLVVGKGYILSAPEVNAVPVVRGEWRQGGEFPTYPRVPFISTAYYCSKPEAEARLKELEAENEEMA